MARALVVTVALLLLGAVTGALAQGISVSGAGCASSLEPGAPQELKAQPGDGKVTLTWKAPANGACVDTYKVTVTPLAGARALGAGAPQETTQFGVEIANLENGQPYKFAVQAYAKRFNGGGQASADATPAAPAPPGKLCTPAIPPSAPTDLKASNVQATSLQLCWGPPGNNGCADEYSVSITPRSEARSLGALPPLSYNQGGCVTIDQLQPGTQYDISVTSVAKAFNSGGTAQTQATTTAA